MPNGSPTQGGERKRLVLLVEDNANLRRLWSELFRLNGYETDMAANGREALDMIAAQEYDAIFSDVHMPLINGRQLFDACQVQFPKAANRIIFISGAWYADSEEMCRETGRPYLLKSFSWDAIHEVLEETFAANDAAESESGAADGD